jgi:hypothetical protein
MDLATIEAAAAAEGLSLRGAFHPGPDDGVPDLAEGRAAATLVLLGNVGGSLWPAFSRTPELADGQPDPLNRWSERVVGGLAAALGARAFYPFGGPPYRPFVAWAKRAEPVRESPLGMLIHPDHGLWHAYRGALAFAERLALPPRDDRPRPCDGCADRPCLTGCPVGAFAAPGPGYDVAACVGHLDGPAGADCLDLGCRARRACPVGRAMHYETAQARLHMAAFLAARRGAAA